MDWIELPHPESPRRRRFGGTARKGRLGKRVERWGLRALAALGCVIALGAGYASATSMASMTVFGIQLPGITSGYVNGIADSDKGLLFSEGQTNAQAVVGAIAPDGATSVVDSDLALGSAPFEMAEDPAGNIWVADTGVPAGIVKIAPDGEKTRFPTPRAAHRNRDRPRRERLVHRATRRRGDNGGRANHHVHERCGGKSD